MSSEADTVLAFGRVFLADRDGYIVVLNVFMDESGVHDNAPAIAVGAWVGRPEAWAEWTDAWNAAKKPIHVYHAADCHNRSGEFEGWEKPERDDFVRKMLSIMGSAPLASFCAGIVLTDYREVVAEHPELGVALGKTPYAPCFQWVLMNIFDAMDRVKDPQAVAIVHETNDYEGEAFATFHAMEARYPNREMTLAFGAKKAYVPLQAADILAYEAYKTLQNVNAPGRKPFMALNPTRRARKFQYFDKVALLRWVKIMEERKPVASAG
jgi:hypothetical protein